MNDVPNNNRGKQVRGKKGQRKEYEVNIRKRKRNGGESYLTKAGKIVPAKIFTNVNCQCPRKCIDKITENSRKTLFEKFWSMADFNLQNSYLNGLCTSQSVKRRRPSNGNGKQKGHIYTYHLEIDSNRFVVCKSAFLNTFGISNGRLGRLLNKSKTQGTPHVDKRGKHVNRYCIPDAISNEIKDHIRSFPVSESHYCREDNPNKMYLNPDLNISKMYILYVEKCKEENIPFAGEHIYRKNFHNDFNLSFRHPRQDTCSTCDTLDLNIKACLENEEKMC